MRKIITIVITILFFTACKNKQPENINLKFTYISEGASENLKQQFNRESEFVNSRKTSKGIEITVDKYVTGIPYYGKARVVNDTLYLDYWTNINQTYIPSVLVASRFKYEIVDIPYKKIKFNFLGNKFKSKANRFSR